MKRPLFFLATVLIWVGTATAQTSTSTQPQGAATSSGNPPSSAAKPAPQAGTSPAGAGAPAAANPSPATSPATVPVSAQVTPPTRTRPLPQAKSKEEFDAYQAAASKPDPASAEAAVTDFAAKYPNSELRPLLYSQMMGRYQQANNADKTIEMGRKILEIDPDNPVALVMTATILAERTRESDLDRDERYAEATKDATRAMTSVDTDLMVGPATPPEQLIGAKATIVAMVHAALGTIELNRKNDAAAETELRTATQVPQWRDALTWLRLALAQDHQKKYAEALASANKAVELSADNEAVGGLSRQERDRLLKLTGAPAPPATAGPAVTAPGAGAGRAQPAAPPPGTATPPPKPKPPATPPKS